MWAVVILTLHALSGAQTRVITQPPGEPHVFATEAECKARLDADIPAKLGEKSRKQVEDGYRRYVCVRIGNPEVMTPPK